MTTKIFLQLGIYKVAERYFDPIAFIGTLGLQWYSWRVIEKFETLSEAEHFQNQYHKEYEFIKSNYTKISK